MKIILSSLLLLVHASSAQSLPTPDWFGNAKFGIHLPSGADAQAWMPRIARAGAKYVVSDTPTDGLAEIAEKHQLVLLRSSGYRNVGQLVPSAPLKGAAWPVWEARFDMTDESGGATSRELIRLLVEVVSKGGNLLLRLPPDTGLAIRNLEEIGQWLQVHGESIYNTSKSPFDRMPFFGRATASGNTLYVHLYDWPADGRLRIAGLRNQIVSAQLLGNGGVTMLKKVQADTIAMPGAAPRSAAVHVVQLTLNGPPKIDPYIVQPDASGVLTARVESCEFETKPGQIARKESRDGHVFISHWTRAIDVPTWKVTVPRDGRYAAEIVYAAGKESAGVLYTITMKGLTMGMVKGVVEASATSSRKAAGTNMVLEAGNYMLFVQPENKAGQPAMQLEAVLLRRIGD